MNGTRYLFSTVFMLFDYVNVLAGLGEEEFLTCELLESILVGGQALDLFLEPGDVGLIELHLLFLASDVEAGLYPAEEIVSFDDTDEEQEDGGGYDDIPDEGALLVVRPVLGSVPDFAELAHRDSIGFAQK